MKKDEPFFGDGEGFMFGRGRSISDNPAFDPVMKIAMRSEENIGYFHISSVSPADNSLSNARSKAFAALHAVIDAHVAMEVAAALWQAQPDEEPDADAEGEGDAK